MTRISRIFQDDLKKKKKKDNNNNNNNKLEVQRKKTEGETAQDCKTDGEAMI